MKNTPEQITTGVTDLPTPQQTQLHALLTFDDLPTPADIDDRAAAIADLAVFNGLGGDEGDDPHPLRAMIGGALWLMAPLADALRTQRVTPVYAFSRRESERTGENGLVVKTAVFRHIGFIEA